MVETIILNYLNITLDVSAYMEEPERPEGSYVLIEKTGSQTQNRIETAMVAIQSYGKSLAEAAKLNAAVKKAMDGIVSLHSIGSAKLNSDYNYTDMETKRYRYQCVYNIVFYDLEV